MTMKPVLEICAGDLESVAAAAAGGADRVELCSALPLGGITPSEGFIREALAVEGLKCHVLIRPREGDFIYTPAETRAMIADIETAARCGAHGVVVGALLPDGSVDTEVCSRLVDRAKDLGLSVTFHRAFDLVTDYEEALETVIALGADRLLTSGLAATAAEGARAIGRLFSQAAGRISLIAASGVNSLNAAEILRVSGCREIHASARHKVVSPMAANASGGAAMGNDPASDRERMVTSPAEVAAIVNSIRNL